MDTNRGITRVLWAAVILLALIGVAVAARRATVLVKPGATNARKNPAAGLDEHFAKEKTRLFLCEMLIQSGRRILSCVRRARFHQHSRPPRCHRHSNQRQQYHRRPQNPRYPAVRIHASPLKYIRTRTTVYFPQRSSGGGAALSTIRIAPCYSAAHELAHYSPRQPRDFRRPLFLPRNSISPGTRHSHRNLLPHGRSRRPIFR